MEEVRKVVMAISQDIKQQNIEMTRIITETVNKIIDEKLTMFQKQHKEIKEKINEQDKRLDLLEREVRKYNLLIFGVEETETNYKELEVNITNIINETMKIKCDPLLFKCLRRLGKKGDKIRPIIMTFNSMGTKIEIMKSKNNLAHTNYYIKEDYPPKILAKRRELREEIIKLRNEGKHAVIKYDKIIILEDTQKSTPKNKRKLSESPENVVNERKDSKQSTKKAPKRKNNNNLSSFIIRQKPGK